MLYKFADRINRLTPPATRAMAEKAASLKREGFNIVDLTTGEPDFETPPSAMLYAQEAMREGKTHYTATAGFLELREAVVEYYVRRFNLRYDVEEVIVGAGSKPLIYEALGVLVDPGDEVIVIAPAWVSYVEQVKLWGGIPKVVDTRGNHYIPDVEEILRLITPKTVAIILNSPNNPTGVIYPREIVKAICEVAVEKNIFIINDEIYERLTYDGFVYENPLCFVPESRDVVLTINGVSKSFAMTGWRIGYALGPKDVIKKMVSLQGHLTSCASSVSQWAALGALLGAESDLERMKSQYQRRRDLCVEKLSKLSSISFVKPQGAFYFFIDISKIVGKSFKGRKIEDDVRFCEVLLEEKQVALVPGAAFMAPCHVRLSFATDMSAIEDGLARLEGFLNELDN